MQGKQDALLAHASFKPGSRRLYNLTRISDLKASAGQRRRMPFPYTPGAKRALVAENDIVYGMARMYQMMREEEHQGALHVYRTLAKGLLWIGMTLEEYTRAAEHFAGVEPGGALAID